MFTGTPAAAPAPARASAPAGTAAAQAQQGAAGLPDSLTRPADGEPTTDNEFQRFETEAQARAVGPVKWTGPGSYNRRKFNATVAGGNSDTNWVRVENGKVFLPGGQVLDNTSTR